MGSEMCIRDRAKAYGFTKIAKIAHLEGLDNVKQLVKNMNNEPIFLEFIVDSEAKALPKMSVKDE